MSVTNEKKEKKIIHFRFLFYGFLAFLFAIILSPKIYSGDIVSIVVAVLLFVFLFGLCFFRKKFIAFASCFILFFIGNGFYFLGMMPLNFQKNYTNEVSVVGKVSDNITEYEYQTRVLLKNVKIDGDKSKNIFVYIEGDNVEISVGAKLCFETVVNKIKPFELGSFNNSVVRENASYSCSVDYDDLTILAGNMSFDESIRAKIKNTLLANMSETNAYVAFAVLTGEKNGIDGEVYSYYRDTGILHLLTVSGLHVGIIISFLVMLFKLLKINRWINFAIVGVLLILYNYVCGFAPSVMRASIMGMVLLLCKNVGKQYDGLSSLGLAGFVILFINPLYAFDVGFLMSMACVLMIYLLYRPINKFLAKFLPKSIASYISLSVCAQIGTLPFLASFYSKFNFLSFFVNLLVVPMFSIVFIMLFAFLIISMILPFMGFVLRLSDWCFTAITTIAKFYSSTILSVNLKPFNAVVTILVSILLWALSDFLMVKIKAKSVYVVLIVSAILISYALSMFPNKNKNTEIYYVNKYENSSLLFRTKSGQSLLTGYSSNLENLFESQNLPVADYYLSSSYLSISRKQNLDNLTNGYIMCGNKSGDKNETQIIVNEKMKVGDFEITVLQFEKKNIATKIEFDNKSILFTTAKDLGYNEIEFIESNSFGVYDFAFIGNERKLCDNIDANNIISTASFDNTNYSYNENGNLKFILGNNLKVRSID